MAEPAATGTLGTARRATASVPRWIAAALPGLLVALASYVLAVGTEPGRTVDDEAIDHDLDGAGETISRPIARAINPVTVALGAAGLALVAWRRDRRLALGILALVGGTSVATTALKHALGTWDLLGGEGARQLGEGFFPSGHAGAAMALAIALLLTAPSRARPRVALLAIACVATFGVATVAIAYHYPSDVVGGFGLAAAAGGALAAVLVGRLEPTRADQISPPRTWLVPAGALAIPGGALAAAILAGFPLSPAAPALLLSAALLGLAAGGLTQAVLAVTTSAGSGSSSPVTGRR
jgi:membrane-associated phospholipid phosphatase